MKVLLVDDEEHVLDGLTTMIHWKDLSVNKVICAMNGEEALDLYKNERPDLVITDVAMPKMNGLELAAKIRELDTELPILFLSGYDDFEYAREAIKLHVSRYILKPTVFYEIEEAIKEMITELQAQRKQKDYTEQFKQHIEESMSTLREQFLFDLLTGAKREEDLSSSVFEFYGMNEEFTGGIILGLKLYRPLQERARTERDWQLFKFSVENIVMESAKMNVAQEQVEVYILRYTENGLPILIANMGEKESNELAETLSKAILHNVSQFLDLELNIAIGSWCNEVSDLYKSYGGVIETLRLLEFEGYHKIMTVKQAECMVSNKHRYPSRLVQQCVEAMQKFNPIDVARQWNELRLWLMQEDVPLGIVQIVCVSLWGNLSIELSGELESKHDTILPQWIRYAQGNRSKQNVIEWIDNQLNNFLKTLEQRDSQQQAYVKQMVDYIEQHYAESISFGELCQKLHLTRGHLSYLFKREMGVSFIHYLTNYRVERAKEFMLSGKYMIYEISEMVGYSDPAYFSRVFKKVTGVAPLEYF